MKMSFERLESAGGENQNENRIVFWGESSLCI